jgi:16S rRNA (cytidine1402-2'-O)-methyltransferase
MPGTLHVVATPIGNLEDITLRALRVLREVALIAAEDTRRTGRLLTHFGITTPTLSYHEHNQRRRIPELLRRLSAGDAVAVVTDAGTPGISDPGTELVDACIDAGIPVDPVPGASALLAAAMVSGFPLRPLLWLGFTPSKATDRSRFIASVSDTLSAVCFLEAPHRIMATLAAMDELLGPRPIMVARELTKAHQELLRGSSGDVRERLRSLKGEFTIVVSPIALDELGETPGTDESVLEDLCRMAESAAFPTKRALVTEVARRHARPSREVYALLLKQKSSPE